MSRARCRALILAAVLALGLSAALTACAPQPGPGSDGIGQQPIEPDDQGEEVDELPPPPPPPTDEIVDPDQETRRTGPAPQSGGPEPGDQGTQDLGGGRWCEGVAVFWGGEVPEGVAFTIDGITSDPEGLVLDDRQEVCGDFFADRACIGETITTESFICTMVLRATDSFVDGTAVELTGVLECPTKEVCDAMAVRDRVQGPQIFVCDPVGREPGTPCEPFAPGEG